MKKCIWCGRGQKEVSFDTIAHIVPKSLGGKETCDDVCDDCNHYFGTAPRGTNGIPCMDHAFKEIFGAIRMFSQNLNSESYKKFRTTYFTYKHSQRLVKIKHNFDSKKITHQFKRALYEVFFQKYHSVTGDGHNTQFKMIKDYARYNIGNPHVFYAFNNMILTPDDEYKKHPYLPMSKKSLDDMMRYGFFNFWLMGHNFYLEIFPTIANIYGHDYLQEQANKNLIVIKHNEAIYEFDDVMQIDFLMQRFNS